jgi:hypothetical protein
VLVPLIDGETKFAFKFNAANCALDTGLFASYYQHYLINHCFCYTTYCTTKVGLTKFAFKFNAANCALDTGLLASLVLSTFVKPTIALVTPVKYTLSTVPFAFKIVKLYHQLF